MESMTSVFSSNNEVISNSENEYVLPLRINDISDPKEMKRFIKSCELLIRRSPEYHIWTDYIRETLGFVRCQITDELHYQTQTDIHHHPISLYNITKGVINKKIYDQIPFNSFDICSDIMKLHYDLKVPFVVLLKSMHEKFHNGFLKIPINLAHGDLRYFIDNYKEFLEDDDIEIIYDRLSVNFENCGWNNNYNWNNNKYIKNESN